MSVTINQPIKLAISEAHHTKLREHLFPGRWYGGRRYCDLCPKRHASLCS
jgi:hypothetical protein